MRAFGAQMRLVPFSGPGSQQNTQKHVLFENAGLENTQKHVLSDTFARGRPKVRKKRKTRKNTCFRPAARFGALGATPKRPAKTSAFGRRARKRYTKTRVFSRVFAKNTQKHEENATHTNNAFKST